MTHDLLIIGAGPAGLSAATTAHGLGLRVALLDEQARPGGQIYRDVSVVPSAIGRILGPDYLHGKALVQALEASDVEQHFGTTVWDITPEQRVCALRQGRSFELRAPQIIVATGAMERASPLPGWTLPGVLNAGAAQVALKGAGSIPSGRVVLVGGGPLLLLVACQLIDAGATVAALVETSPSANRSAASRHLAGALMAPGPLAKGLGLMARIRRAGVPWFKAAEAVHIEGQDRAEAVRFRCGARTHRIEAHAVLLHHGVVPNTQITRLLRVEHDWNPAQQAWQVRCDAFGQTSRPGVRVAGDGGGIAGALAAEASGTLSALGAAQALGRLTPVDCARAARAPARAWRAQARIRPFLDALYAPPDWIAAPAGDTVVCRCEEVTAVQVADMTRLGCRGPNQTKFFSRCGMGPCQGRLCGLPVTGILARELGQAPGGIGAYHIRAPLKPVPLAAIAEHASLTNGTPT